MKYLIATLALALSTSANAALVESAYYSDNLGGVVQYNIDSDTGEYWLDFGQVVGGEQTFGATIQEAVNYYSVDGWRLATNSEVEQLFYNIFPTYNDGGLGYTDDQLNTWNPELDAGWAEWTFNFGTYAEGGYTSSRGRYIDEDGIEQVIGVAYAGGTQYIFGPEFEYSWSNGTGGLDDFGVMMIYEGGRDLPEVPIPAAGWLMMSGLLGLVGVARRKA